MNPVQYSDASQAIVDAYEALPASQQLPSYWGDVTVSPVRSEIKDHYITEQNYRCVYCNQQIVTANQALWDVEHVISRALAARFMFTRQNLAVSCRDCNIAKGNKEVRRYPNRKSFPEGSQHYLSVHPHYDNYEEHILWIGIVCVPISPKGQKTLIDCNLTRFTAQLLGINGIITDPAIAQLVGSLFDSSSRVAILATLAALTVHVENIPQQ